MDSEHSAFITAQHKHHRYMIFGKKQRYIEVFQCSGEDMNLVLTGGMPTAVSPAKAAPALLSPGMLHNIAPLPPPPTNIPPPPPPVNATVGQIPHNLLQTAAANHHPAAQFAWDNSPLLAQQQAHMIAQQNLIARQTQAAAAQNEHFMIMHNFAVLNQNVPPMSPNSPALQNPIMKAPPPLPIMPHILPQQQPFVLLPRMMAPLGVPRPPTIQYPLIPAGPGVIPMMPNVAVKRTYGDAFADQASPAKRAFHPQQLHSVYPQFYPNI